MTTIQFAANILVVGMILTGVLGVEISNVRTKVLGPSLPYFSIFWETDVDASSKVCFETLTGDFDDCYESSGLFTSHQMTFHFTDGKIYYFKCYSSADSQTSISSIHQFPSWNNPTVSPTLSPTNSPTMSLTNSPTLSPSSSPSSSPTNPPSPGKLSAIDFKLVTTEGVQGFSVSWKTNIPANSKVCFKSGPKRYRLCSGPSKKFVTDHEVSYEAFPKNAFRKFRIRSRSANNLRFKSNILRYFPLKFLSITVPDSMSWIDIYSPESEGKLKDLQLECNKNLQGPLSREITFLWETNILSTSKICFLDKNTGNFEDCSGSSSKAITHSIQLDLQKCQIYTFQIISLRGVSNALSSPRQILVA